MKVMPPVTRPRKTGLPRPVSSPSSDSPSENAIEIPAPTAAAAPIRNTVCEFCVAKAVAKIGASVDTEPSIRPASPGCTTRSRKLRSSCASFAQIGKISDMPYDAPEKGD